MILAIVSPFMYPHGYQWDRCLTAQVPFARSGAR